jgi:hypothetical protein
MRSSGARLIGHRRWWSRAAHGAERGAARRYGMRASLQLSSVPPVTRVTLCGTNCVARVSLLQDQVRSANQNLWGCLTA